MRFLDFIGSSALSSNLLFYLAVWTELNSLNNRVTPPTIQHLALVFLATHNLISLFHAYAFLNWALCVIHFLGLVLHVAFIVAYLKISVHWKRFSLQVLGAIIVSSAVFLHIFSLDDVGLKKERLETLSHVSAGLAYFATPALSLYKAYKFDDNNCVSVWITSSLMWAASLSFLYGFLVKDNAMQLSQIPCIATCLISMGYVWHQDKKRMEELRLLLDEQEKDKKAQ